MDDFEDRWLALVQAAESPQALDWIERQVNYKRAMTERIRTAIDARKKEIGYA